MSASASRRVFWKHPLFFILLLGFALRLAFFLELRPSPFFNAPALDAMEYDQAAREIASGRIAWTEIPIHGPGYPFFLALIYTLSQGSYAAVYWIQFALGLLNACLVYRLGLRALSRTAAIGAAFFAATIWTGLYFEGLLLPTTLIISWNLLTLICLESGQRSSRAWPWFLAGCCLGLSAVTWPLILAFLAGLILWLMLFPPAPLSRPALIPAGLILFGAALIIAPVTLQNWRAEEDFILVQKNGGLNFFLGNNPNADGTPNVRPTGDWDQLMLRPVVEAGLEKQSARDRFFAAGVLEFARTSPGRFLNLQARKLALLFNAREIRATFDPEFFRRQYRTLSLPLPGFALILSLALLGMVRLRPPFPALLLLYLVCGSAAVVLTVVSARYRMPLVPALALFAGHGLAELGRLIREGEFRTLGLALPFLLLVDLASHCTRLVPKHSNAEEFYHLGNAYQVRHELYAAEISYRRALEQEPGYSLAMTGLAVLSWDQGHQDRALELLRRALARDPSNIPTRYQYADYLRQLGMFDQALAEYQLLLRQWPGHASAHFFIGLIKLEQGDYRTARQEAEMVLRIRPRDPQAEKLLQQIQDHEQNQPPDSR